MAYCEGNLSGWFDDLLQAGEKIATTISRPSVPVGYGTYGAPGTPPFFPPSYGVPAVSPSQAGFNLETWLPYLVIGGVVLYLVSNMSARKRR